jgi:23S rRNA (cytidine1920-2'-O)/16S rRNA (cytidine1409-2'-O)-methyltransferase
VPKQRLDQLLCDRQLCDSRQQAQRLIRAGEVRVGDQLIDKPGTLVADNAVITVKRRSPYVSRGGEKLAKALSQFSVEVAGRICLDGGISTGGFTDCLLQAGAERVYGIDVGYGQVDWKLRNDPRLVLRERTNLRYLSSELLYSPDDRRPTLGVADVSFISLAKVLPALWSLLEDPRELILLVKPQFEVGRQKVGKNGVIREPRDHVFAILQVLNAAQVLGWRSHGLTWSPLTGPAGNIEYLLWLGTREEELRLTESEALALVTEAQWALKTATTTCPKPVD